MKNLQILNNLHSLNLTEKDNIDKYKVHSLKDLITTEILQSVLKDSESQVFPDFVGDCLLAHHCGEWGDFRKDEITANNNALRKGNRVVSQYQFQKELIGKRLGFNNSIIKEGDSILIVTDAANEWGIRGATTIMFSEELPTPF